MILADFKKRAFAAFIDYFLFISFDFIFLVQFGKHSTNSDGRPIVEAEGFLAYIPLIIWFITFPVVESIEGKTLGKKIMRIKVVREDGSNINFFTSFQRRIFDFVDFLLLGLPAIIVSRNNIRRKRIGDWVARTIVVNDNPDKE